MRKQMIAVTFLVGALMMGVSACGQSNSAQTPQSDSTATASTPSNTASAPDQTQKADRAQKREAVRKQILAVLTQEQAQQFQTKVQSGEKMRQALREVNLTADQKTKIQDILKAAYPRPQGTQSQKGDQKS